MDFEKFTFKESYKGGKLNFDFDIRLENEHGRTVFDNYKSLIYFLEENPTKQIFITKTQIDDFYEDGDFLVLNLNKYTEFCKNISQSGKKRAQAFFSRSLIHYSDEEEREKKEKIILGLSEIEILSRINSFSQEQKNNFIKGLKGIENIELPNEKIENISNDDFIDAFGKLMTDPSKQNLVISEFPQIQINILEKHKKFLEDNLDKNETHIQNWLDGKINNDGTESNITDEGELKKIRKSRCLIFGLEFINHVREGVNSSKRIDVLTKLSENKNEYVIFELKSPNTEVFKIKEVENDNGGKSTEYHLSPGIARSLPQILRYKDNLNDKPEEDEDWQKMGIKKGKVVKCIILIGTKIDSDPLWKNHFLSLKNSLSGSLEIITYTDLIDKIETTIKNLKDNLN